MTVSLLLHGAALLLLHPGNPPPARPPPVDPLTVELRGPVAAGPGAALRPASPVHPASVPSPAPRSTAAPTPPPAPAPSPLGAGAGAATTRALLEASGLAATGPRGGADLGLRIAPPVPGRGASAAAAGLTTEGRVAAVLAEAMGQDRVRRSVDPAWSPLAEQLRDAFRPDWSLLDEGPSPGAVTATGLARMLPGYLRMAQRFAASQPLSDADGAMGDRRSEAGKVTDRLVAAGGQSTLGIPPPVERMENPFQREYLALVEVAHRDDGAADGVRLRRSCGLAAVDRLALAATRRALVEGRLRPGPGLARVSIWAFTATFGVLPPAPSIACPPDVLWKGGLDRCAYPLKRTAAGRVELHALE